MFKQNGGRSTQGGKGKNGQGGLEQNESIDVLNDKTKK